MKFHLLLKTPKFIFAMKSKIRKKIGQLFLDAGNKSTAEREEEEDIQNSSTNTPSTFRSSEWICQTCSLKNNVEDIQCLNCKNDNFKAMIAPSFSPLSSPQIPLLSSQGFINVFVMRHGERIDDFEKNWEVSALRPYDPPLTSAGMQNAASKGKFLKDQGIQCVYTSPFLRCVQTAAGVKKAIGGLDMPVIVMPGLSEVCNISTIKTNKSALQSEKLVLPLSELRQHCSSLEHSSTTTMPVWGETSAQARSRILSTIQSVANTSTSNVLFVTHGEAAASMVSVALPSVLVYSTEYCCCVHLVLSATEGWKMGNLGWDVSWMDSD